MATPLVTVHITSYNRFLHLKNLIDSFVHCNKYKNVEMVIVDNGSTDQRLLKYYKKLNLPFPFQVIRNEENDYPRCIWHAKNQARSVANGDYFLDIPDDHQFVREGNWIKECIDIYSSIDKVGSIVIYAYPIFRWGKSNNLLNKETSINNIPFFISHFKGYVDYHFMSRRVYEEVGPFLDDGYDDPTIPEPDYMSRCTNLGLKRLFLKYPAAVAIPEFLDDKLVEFGDNPVYPYISEERYITWRKLPRPVCAEELRYLAHSQNIFYKQNIPLVKSSLEKERSILEGMKGNTIFDSKLSRIQLRLRRRLAKLISIQQRGF